jgi:hypothetical protein
MHAPSHQELLSCCQGQGNGALHHAAADHPFRRLLRAIAFRQHLQQPLTTVLTDVMTDTDEVTILTSIKFGSTHLHRSASTFSMLPAVRRRRVIVISDSDDDSSLIVPSVAVGASASAPEAIAASANPLPPPVLDDPTGANSSNSITISANADDDDVSSCSGSSDSNPVSRKARKWLLRRNRRNLQVAAFDAAGCTPFQHTSQHGHFPFQEPAPVSLPQLANKPVAHQQAEALTPWQYAAKYGRFPTKPPAVPTSPPAVKVPEVAAVIALPPVAVHEVAAAQVQPPSADAHEPVNALAGHQFLDDNLYLWNATPPATRQWLDLFAAHDAQTSSGSTGSSDGSLSGDFVDREDPELSDSETQTLIKLFPLTYKKMGFGKTRSAQDGSAILTAQPLSHTAHNTHGVDVD